MKVVISIRPGHEKKIMEDASQIEKLAKEIEQDFESLPATKWAKAEIKIEK